MMLTLNLKHFILSSLSLSVFIAAQSHAAAVLEPSTEPVSVLAPYAISDTNVGDASNPAKAYRPWFENGSWQGDLIEYDISTGGLLSTTVDSSAQPPTTSTINGSTNWSARIQFDAAVTASSTYWTSGRKIIFHNGSIQKAFRWANLSAAQKTALDATAPTISGSTSDNLDYVRGDESNEADQGAGANRGTLRVRYNLLGDIIHSNPIYIAAPDSSFTSLPGYSDFKNQDSDESPSGYANRAARVYVGSNDGMLHAFDAANGNEVWAYVPSMIINKLDKLTAVPFSHTYYVDGQLAEGDMDFDIASDAYEWHSVLAGGLGSGAKGFFALDITNASLSLETSTAAVDKKILFELDGTNDDIGYIHGKAQVARLDDAHSNKWTIITGNGYDSTNDKAVLLIIDKEGSVTTIATDNTTSNGLSAPTLIDVDNDFDVDYAYAGDLQGNLWKFDLTVSPATSSKLYAAGSDKPITSAPDIRVHPNGGYLIYFGTGSLLSAADATNTSIQSIFAIWDGATGGSAILTQTLSTDTHSYDDAAKITVDNATGTVTTTVRTSTNDVIDWATYKGWQVDLNISGERLVTDPIIRADRLQFVTHNPLTGTHGDGWLLQLNFLNGGTGAGVFLDLNNDGSLTSADQANSNIPVGINLGNGSFSGPEIARVTNSRDTMFINGLFLAYTEACTEGCSFQGGNIYVTSDSPSGVAAASPNSDSYCFAAGDRAAGIPVDSSGNSLPSDFTNAVIRLGGTLVTNPPAATTQVIDGIGQNVDGFVNEYDKKHGQVYVDLINLEPLCSQTAANNATNLPQDLARITEAKITNYDKKFFVILANADFSPDSTLQIGAREWNVVVYQKLIQQKLDAWTLAGSNASLENNGTNSFGSLMVDDDGVAGNDDSLLYSINTIMSAGSGTGTLRHSFDSLSIVSGGLFPNQASCIIGEPEENITNPDNISNDTADTGRWRGGALVTQLIGVTEYLADTGTVVKQNPTDLYRVRTIDDVDVLLKIDNNSDGDYIDTGDEIYGGLRARYRVGGVSTGAVTTNAAFLYESTMHWDLTGSCYGTTNWQAFVNGVANSSSTSSLLGQIAVIDLSISKAKAALQVLIDADASDTAIARKRLLIANLEERKAEIEAAIAATSIQNTGTPTAPTDTNSVIAPSLGPNFQTGRRTWIDLTP